jgi:hypothetical protein
MHTEDKEPAGIAEGQTSNASQQSKHFQCGSATVLCTTVNSEAGALLGNVERLVRENRVRSCRRTSAIFEGGHSNGGRASQFFSKMASAPFLNAPRH